MTNQVCAPQCYKLYTYVDYSEYLNEFPHDNGSIGSVEIEVRKQNCNIDKVFRNDTGFL